MTPFQRVQAYSAVSGSTKQALTAQFKTLNPVALLHDIREAQTRLAALADAKPPADLAACDGKRVGVRSQTWRNHPDALDALRGVEASRARGHQDPTVALASPSENRHEYLAEATA